MNRFEGLKVRNRFKGLTVRSAPRDPDRPEEYGDINWWETLRSIPGDIGPTLGEEVEGLGELISHPIETAKTIGKAGAGAADVLLGTDIAAPESEELAREIYREYKESVSPGGIQGRPVRAAVNVASVIPSRMLGALGKAGKIGKAASVAGRVLGNPIGEGIGLAGRGARAAGRATARGTRGVAKAVTGVPDTGELLRQIGDSIAGFATGKGGVAINDMIRKVMPDEGMRTLFEEFRNKRAGTAAERAGALDEIVRDVALGVDRLRDEASTEYMRLKGQATILQQPIEAMPGLMDDIRARWSDVDPQVRIVREQVRKRRGPPLHDFYEEPGGWRVVLDDIFEGQLQQDAPPVRAAMEEVLNHDVTRPLDDLNEARVRLDKAIHKASPGPAKDLLFQVRNQLSDALREGPGEIDPRYKTALDYYKERNTLLDEIERTMAVDKEAVGRDGFVRKGDIRSSTVMSNLVNAYTDSERHAADLHILDEVSRAAETPINVKVLGLMFGETFPGNLVARGQFAGAGRALMGAVTVGIGAGLAGTLGAVAASLPLTVLYSPKFLSAAMMAFGRRMDKPPSGMRKAVQQLRRNVTKLRQHPVAGPIVREGMRNGWQLGRVLRSLEQQGVNIEAILNPNKRERPSEQPRLLRSLARTQPR